MAVVHGQILLPLVFDQDLRMIPVVFFFFLVVKKQAKEVSWTQNKEEWMTLSFRAKTNVKEEKRKLGHKI